MQKGSGKAVSATALSGDAPIRGSAKSKANQLYQAALRLARRKQYRSERVLTLLNDAIALGSPEAAYALATWYIFGQHVKKDRKKAVDLLRRATAANLPSAWYDLAVCYEKGAGTGKNLKKAFEAYLHAALYGDEQSGYAVGRCYFWGIGVRQNRQLAAIWLDRLEAAETKKRLVK